MAAKHLGLSIQQGTQALRGGGCRGYDGSVHRPILVQQRRIGTAEAAGITIAARAEAALFLPSAHRQCQICPGSATNVVGAKRASRGCAKPMCGGTVR